MPFGINKNTGRPGPAPIPARDGDRKQARKRVNLEVRMGRLPHPNVFPCVDCGHVHSDGERRHEYDHYLGYGKDHHLSVEPVCTKCHAKRDSTRKKQTHCKRGHEFTEQNTFIKANGTRGCIECRRAYDRGRRDAEYWRSYRRKHNGTFNEN